MVEYASSLTAGGTFTAFLHAVIVLEWFAVWKFGRQPERVDIVQQAKLILAELANQPPSVAKSQAIQSAKALLRQVDKSPPGLQAATDLQEHLRALGLRAFDLSVGKAIAQLSAEDRSHHKDPVSYWVIFAVMGALWLVMFCITTGVVLYHWDRTSKNYELKDAFAIAGTLGDSFGLLTSLLTGLTLAGAIYSVLLARRDLALQREEMALTRQELAVSAEAQSRSEESLLAQALINGYTSLADYHRRQQEGQFREAVNVVISRWSELAYTERLNRQIQLLSESYEPDDPADYSAEIIARFSGHVETAAKAHPAIARRIAMGEVSVESATSPSVELAGSLTWIGLVLPTNRLVRICIDVATVIARRAASGGRPDHERIQDAVRVIQYARFIADVMRKPENHPPSSYINDDGSLIETNILTYEREPR